MEKEENSMIVIDTNIFVDHLRNYPPAVDFFDKIDSVVLFSAITEAELLAGHANNDKVKREKLLHFLNRWTKISVDNPLVVAAGDISRKYGLEVPDAIIAATALSNNAELITRNVKDFRSVSDLKVRRPY